MYRKLQLCWLICILFSATLAPAQSSQWTLVGPAFSASVADLQAASAKIKTEDFASATILFERDAFAFDSASRMSYRHTIIFRIETEEGLKSWSEIRVNWMPWHQNPPEIHARIISPDGKVTILDPKTITDGPARADEQDTYTDARVRKVPLPAAAIGSIVEEETLSSDIEPLFSAGIGYGNGFSWSVPFHRGQLRIDVPTSLNFRIKLFSLPDAVVKDEVVNNIRHYSLDQNYIPPMNASDIVLATHQYRGHGSRFSTGESWNAVANAYLKLAANSIDPVKAKAILPKPGATREETIARIVAALHKSVRYTGIEFGQAALQPTPIPEILKRHYGDCKDKAALLVSMLRAAGIDANMALLDTGPGLDVDPDLPGMQFDHAIVYLPPTQGQPAMWIDATAEYAKAGSLPAMDEGRNALIIAENTTALTPTPVSQPDDQLLIEERSVAMADYGASKIIEKSISCGQIDASYRYLYGGDLSRELKEELERYAKNVYLAKNLQSVTHGEARDLTRPFNMTLEMTEAKRGDTGTEDAVLNIQASNIFSRLPEWFRQDPGTEGVKLTSQEEENHKRAVAARSSQFDLQPFATEWHYIITPPEGFTLRALPADKSTPIGPALLTQKYESHSDGKILATIRFENPKSRATVDEVLAMRDAVLAAYKLPPIAIWFDQDGARFIASGKIREALNADRNLITKSPAKGIHHAQMAYAYLKASMGLRARKEALAATQLDPHSAISFRALGQMCEYNDLGFYMGNGFDWNCSQNAFKKAIALDPENTDLMADLALLDEYGPAGERYAADAPLKDAILQFRALKQKDKDAGEKYQDNILMDLLYSRQYQELLDELEKLPSSPLRRAMNIAATVAKTGGQNGIEAGRTRANQLSANGEERNTALNDAGNQLMRLRLYSESSAILSLALSGQQNSASTSENIELMSQLKPWNHEYLPGSNPLSAVQRFVLETFMGTFSENSANEIMTRHGYSSEQEWKRNLERIMQTTGALKLRAERSNMPSASLMDFIAGHLKMTIEGSDDSGYRATAQNLGSNATKYFVTRDEGRYRLLAAEASRNAVIGNYLLYLLHNQRDTEAHALLDWARNNMHKGGGDDPLSGPLLPRFWSVGSESQKSTMQLAAISLMVEDSSANTLVPELRAALQNTTDQEKRLDLNLALCNALQTAQDGAQLKQCAAEILLKYPDSYTALGFAAKAFEYLKEWDSWKQMLDAQLAHHPDDAALLRLRVNYLQAHGEWQAARATQMSMIEKGNALATDYENYAWSTLFDHSTNDEAIKQSRQANTLTQNSDYEQLHALACLYLAMGKTDEARDLIYKTMSYFNMAQPISTLWYAFGQLYENYGINDAALEAYRKVDKPEGYISPTRTWSLAQERIAQLQKPRP